MLPSPTRMSLPLNPTQCRLVPYPQTFARHCHWRTPPACRFVQHPTCVRLRRDKRVAHRVICVADASVVKPQRCPAAIMYATACVVARLHPLTAKQVSTKRRADCAVLNAIHGYDSVVYNGNAHNQTVNYFCVMCHAMPCKFRCPCISKSQNLPLLLYQLREYQS